MRSRARGVSSRVWIAAGAAFLAGGCGGDAAAGASGQTSGGGAREQRIVPVEVAIAELGTAARVIAASGTVEPIRSVGINSQLAGALLAVNVEEGDAVRTGTVLASIDARELRAQLRSAQASLDVARRTAERAASLREQQIVTEAEYERDQAAYAAARATADQLATRVGFATVRAPIAGIVTEKRLERGDIVNAQTRLFTIADVSTLVVRVPVSELDVTALRAGAPVDVSLDALPGRPVEGRIRRIFPSADTTTRLVPVEVELRGARARDVRPGFLARVTFRLDPRTGVLMVPGGAVVDNAGGRAVFVVRDGRANLQRVRSGATYEGRVEILDGIRAGDTVVVAGNSMLRDGAAVRIVSSPLRDLPAAPPSDAARSDSMAKIGAAR